MSEEYTPTYIQTLARDKEDILIHTKHRHTEAGGSYGQTCVLPTQLKVRKTANGKTEKIITPLNFSLGGQRALLWTVVSLKALHLPMFSWGFFALEHIPV